MTKKEKRNKKKKDRGIVDFMRIQMHFFPNLSAWFNQLNDPRHQSYTTYQQADMLYMGILKNVCSVESMRQMEESFNEETCIETLKILSGNKKLEEMPHYDTLNTYLERLSPEELSLVRQKMIAGLIRRKQFYRSRLLGKYWRIIIDGTGLFHFKEKHCDHCLRKTEKKPDGTVVTSYYHNVLEAKLVLGEDLVISLDTEFIENESEKVTKQDCETNAAKRLLGRIKKNYPRLPICILGDALYATESVMEICRNNNWKYILTQKETRQRLIAENYTLLGEEDKPKVEKVGKEKGIGRYYNHVEVLAGKEEVMNVYEYEYEEESIGENGEKKSSHHRFQWLTNIEVTQRNLSELIDAGRGRWKIENEGFNNQKNGLYRIEHLNSRNENAMKNHYLLTQIADIIMQLYLGWNPMIKEIGQSIKNTASLLLESFRRQPVTEEDVQYAQRYTSIYL